MITATALISGCNSPKEEQQVFIGKQEVSLSSDLMTPEALWAMGRIGGVQPSPDGSKILYNVSYYSVKENRSHTVICLMNADGSDVKTLTKSPKSQGGAVWLDDNTIAYLTSESDIGFDDFMRFDIRMLHAPKEFFHLLLIIAKHRVLFGFDIAKEILFAFR